MISYIGGKGRIGSWIEPHIAKDIETYVEPFGGMFWVFFKMDFTKYPNLKTIVYNDYNQLNSNLFRCAKEYDKLWDEMSKYPCQQLKVVDTDPMFKEMFDEYQKEVFSPNYVVDDEPNFDAAIKYLYVLTHVFSGSKPETATYTDYKGKYRDKFLIFMDKLKKPLYREHFDKITFVENLDFADVMMKYDSPTTYFYLDPPYWKTENYYSNHDFDVNDHRRLADLLKSTQGRFSLSYYEFPQLFEWFPTDQYTWRTKQFKKAASAKKDGTQNVGTELLIMNYDPPIPPEIEFDDGYAHNKLERLENIDVNEIIEDVLREESGGESYGIDEYLRDAAGIPFEEFSNNHPKSIDAVRLLSDILTEEVSKTPQNSTLKLTEKEIETQDTTFVEDPPPDEHNIEPISPETSNLNVYKSPGVYVQEPPPMKEYEPTIDDQINLLTEIVFDNLFGLNNLLANTDDNKKSIIRTALYSICKECKDK